MARGIDAVTADSSLLPSTVCESTRSCVLPYEELLPRSRTLLLTAGTRSVALAPRPCRHGSFSRSRMARLIAALLTLPALVPQNQYLC
jgi:hypothetical protein